MAQLFRVLRHNDGAGTRTFTFILPAAVTRHSETLSRDFTFGCEKWRMSFRKQDKHLSPYLRLISVSDGTRVCLDYRFVLINRDTFSKNETFQDKQRQFDTQYDTHGQRTFVTTDELPSRHFTDARGEFLFELTMWNMSTSFEYQLHLAPPQRGDSRHRDKLDYQRYDTASFFFGELEWTAVFCPNIDVLPDGTARHMVQINRVTKCDHLCKLRYRLTIGKVSAAHVLKSELLEEVFDFNGSGEGFYFTQNYFQYATSEYKLLLGIELVSLNCLCQVKLNVLSETKNRTTLHDKDRQSWSLSGCAADERLALNLVYTDVANVPSNYLRYVSWTLLVLPNETRGSSNGSNRKPETCLGAPFDRYYASTMKTDSGYRMETSIPVSELATSKKWLDEDKKLTLCVEWHETWMLVNATYNVYDDVLRRSILQMRGLHSFSREIQALQAENYLLEKEMHNYQMSIATKCGSDLSQQGSPSGPAPPRRPSFNNAEDAPNRTTSTGNLYRSPNSGGQNFVVSQRFRDRKVSNNGRPSLASQPSKDSGIIPDVHSTDSSCDFASAATVDRYKSPASPGVVGELQALPARVSSKASAAGRPMEFRDLVPSSPESNCSSADFDGPSVVRQRKRSVQPEDRVLPIPERISDNITATRQRKYSTQVDDRLSPRPAHANVSGRCSYQGELNNSCIERDPIAIRHCSSRRGSGERSTKPHADPSSRKSSGDKISVVPIDMEYHNPRRSSGDRTLQPMDKDFIAGASHRRGSSGRILPIPEQILRQQHDERTTYHPVEPRAARRGSCVVRSTVDFGYDENAHALAAPIGRMLYSPQPPRKHSQQNLDSRYNGRHSPFP